MVNSNYNPDVLNCIANLSNDEVFTPPELANRVLDLLPQDLFKSPDTKFLDPFSKSGVFLREIVKRLDRGLEAIMPDRQLRIDHILHNQVFGIAITELTSYLSRRSLYCSKHANGKYSVSKFDTDSGNILYVNKLHTWENGKCKYCGVSQAVYDRGSEAEQYAYMFIHTDNPKQFFGNMKFDVIVGNPPYQMNVGIEKENYAIAIYNRFVEQAKKLKPRYLSMIIPARWYAGGRGLDDFRDSMLHDNSLRIIHDFPDASDCFPGVQIKAGVCYFLWDRDNKGDCRVITHMNNKITEGEPRPLLEKNCDTFIRYNEAVSILRKVQKHKEKSFSDLVSPQTPFGIITSYKGTKERHDPSDVKMYISGNDKQFKGSTAFAPLSMITKGKEMRSWHKVYIGEAGSGSDSFPHSILSVPFYGEPDSICNQSYLVIGPFKDKKECENVISYIKTKFLRFLVLQKKNAQHAMRQVYQFVPIQDFSHPWTDEMLYKKYSLTDDEIAFIDSMIRPME
jgi:site-specific DNA-methyltransferase (adenine-specific)